MNIGGQEILVVMLLALIFFGPKKLPEIGRGLGQAMRELKRMSNEVTSAFEEAIEEKPTYSTTDAEWEHPKDMRSEASQARHDAAVEAVESNSSEHPCTDATSEIVSDNEDTGAAVEEPNTEVAQEETEKA